MKTVLSIVSVLALAWSAAAAALSSCKREHGEREAASAFAAFAVLTFCAAVIFGVAAWWL